MNKKEFIRNRPFDENDATQMQQWTEDGMIDYVKSLSTDGVIIGLETVANTGMTLKVKAGIALDSAYRLLNVLTDQVVNIAAANATNSRIDVITLTYKNTKTDNVDTANKYNRGTSFVYSRNIVDGYQLKVYTGTPAASPVAPSVTAGEVVLSQVLIPANATTPSTITDRKKKTAMVNAVEPIKSPTAPTQNLYEGLIWFNTTTKEFKIYVNGVWEGINSHTHTIAQITGLQAALDAKEIPSGAQAKANTAEANAKAASVSKAGDTMTGDFKLERTGTAPRDIMWSKDGVIQTNLGMNSSNKLRLYDNLNAVTAFEYDTATKSFDVLQNTNLLKKAGDTMSGTLKSTFNHVIASKLSGYKSWLFHSPNRNSFLFAPSATINGEDWDWTKQIEFVDTGSIIATGNMTATNAYFGGTITEGGSLLSAKYASVNTTIGAGTGITGGGSLASNRTLAFDTTWGDARYVNKAGDTMSGILTIARTQGRNFVLKQTDSDTGFYNYMGWLDKDNALTAYVGYDSGKSGNFVIKEYTGDVNIASGSGKVVKADGNRVLTVADYGTGKGIDADSVDGVHLAGLVQTSRKVNPGTGLTGGGDLAADRSLNFDTTWGDSRYLNKSVGGAITGAVSMYALSVNPASATPTYLELGWQGAGAAATTIDFHSGGTAGVDYDSRIYASGGTTSVGGGTLNFVAANVQANGNNILTVADEGHGKGIDADTVDGVHLTGLVQTARKINPGTGLTGGGDFTADRTLNFDTVWGDARYANVTGQTFTGSIGFSAQGLGMSVPYVPSANTPATWTSGGGITGGADASGLSKLNNVAIQTWYGFSISPTIANMEVPQGTPAFSVDARTGDVWAAKEFYAKGNQKVWHAGNFNPATKVDTTRQVATGSGLTGGGDLSANRTIGVSFTSSGGNNGTAVSVARGDHLHDGIYAKTAGDIFTAPMEFKKGLSITGAIDPGNVLNFPNAAAVRFDSFGNILGPPVTGSDITFSIADGGGRRLISMPVGKASGGGTMRFEMYGGATNPFSFYQEGKWILGLYNNGPNVGLYFDGGPILKWQRQMGRFEMRSWDDGAYSDFAAGVMWSSEYRTHSTRDLKKNIKLAIGDALEVIKSTPIFDYNLKTEEDNEPKTRGMVVEESHPDVVAKDGKSISMYAVDSAVWRALQAIIKVLEKNELI